MIIIFELNKSRDVAVGYALGYNDGLGQNDNSTDEWKFPEDWINIPDPSPNQIVMLMDCRKYSVTPMIGLWYDGTYGGVTIDCGDGQVITIPEGEATQFVYAYSRNEQYIMTITSNYIQGVTLSSPNYNNGCEYSLKAIKVGENMKIAGNTFGGYMRGLVYAEFFGEAVTYYGSCYNLECVKAHIPPTQLQDRCFNNCYNLKYLYNYLDELTVLPRDCFYTTGLEVISLPKVTSISYSGSSQYSYGISYCRNLKKVFAPLLTEISSGDFSSCYRLQELTLADNANTNGNIFSDCYLLR